MSDGFDRILRDGTTRFGADLNPSDAHLVRARGDKRRKRKAAGSLAIALVIVAGSGTAYALGHPGRSAPPVSPATATAVPTPAPTATHTPAAIPDKTLQLGHLILRVPDAWRVTYRNAQGDYTVSTGVCAGDDLIGAAAGSSCAAFSLIAAAGAQHGGLPPYAPGVRPYTTSTGVTGCPDRTPSSWSRSTPLKPYYSGYSAVTSTRTADYTVWQFGCETGGTASTPILYFQQRDWYLPVSDILIVDEYSTPGLAQILAAATWK